MDFINNVKIIDMRVVPGDSGFLLDDGETSILYDTGFAFTGEALAKKVKDYLQNRKLDYIFLTHSHYDHALGSVYVKKLFSEAKIVAGEYAAKIFGKASAKAIMRDLDRKFATKCNVQQYKDLIDDLSVDITVKEGDFIKTKSLEFEVIDLPGHTKCSVGFYCKNQKLLLGTETLGVFNGKNDVVPSYLVSYENTLKSLEKAKNLEIDGILVPHYGLVKNETAKFYLEKGEERAIFTANSIKKMFQSGKSKEEIFQWFKDEFYKDYIVEIYPIDAMKLNTSIMIDLIQKEVM